MDDVSDPPGRGTRLDSPSSTRFAGLLLTILACTALAALAGCGGDSGDGDGQVDGSDDGQGRDAGWQPIAGTDTVGEYRRVVDFENNLRMRLPEGWTFKDGPETAGSMRSLASPPLEHFRFALLIDDEGRQLGQFYYSESTTGFFPSPNPDFFDEYDLGNEAWNAMKFYPNRPITPDSHSVAWYYTALKTHPDKVGWWASLTLNKGADPEVMQRIVESARWERDGKEYRFGR